MISDVFFFFMREYITVNPAFQFIHRRPIRQFHVETETYSRGEFFRRNNVSAKLKRWILTKQQVHFRPFHSEMPSSSSVKNVLLNPEGTWLSSSPRQVGNTNQLRHSTFMCMCIYYMMCEVFSSEWGLHVLPVEPRGSTLGFLHVFWVLSEWFQRYPTQCKGRSQATADWGSDWWDLLQLDFPLNTFCCCRINTFANRRYNQSSPHLLLPVV